MPLPKERIYTIDDIYALPDGERAEPVSYTHLLNATEEYLKEAIQCYHSKYSLYAVVDNYVIYFEPYAVIHMI